MTVGSNRDRAFVECIKKKLDKKHYWALDVVINRQLSSAVDSALPNGLVCRASNTQQTFFIECLLMTSVWPLTYSIFAECNVLPKATLGKL